MRQGYANSSLTKDDLNPDPIQQFEEWSKQASDSEPIPYAMSVATTGKSNKPALRTVLLKVFDVAGFVFFTNYSSRKARQISENSNVAALFHWMALERQVHITGTAEKVDASESLKYFLSRPKGSQLGAWVSEQSSVLTSRKVLEAKLEEMKRKFDDGKIPLPDFWGGYRIKPETIEFWQGQPDRLHDRFLYTLNNQGDWQIDRLAP